MSRNLYCATCKNSFISNGFFDFYLDYGRREEITPGLLREYQLLLVKQKQNPVSYNVPAMHLSEVLFGRVRLLRAHSGHQVPDFTPLALAVHVWLRWQLQTSGVNAFT